MLLPSEGQLATDPTPGGFLRRAGAETSPRVTRASASRPQNSSEAPDLEVNVPSGRQGAPGTARERTRTSIDATAVWTQCRSDPSASGYCTCTICSTVARTTPSIESRASCAEKCQAGAVGRETESNIQGSSPNRCVPPRKRSTKRGSRTLRGPSTSSRSTEASGSSVNPEQRAQAQAGQYDRPTDALATQ